MDAIVPGGVARDLDAEGIARMRSDIAGIGTTVTRLKDIYDDHAGLQDRFVDCGRIRQDQAERQGLTGLAGRASGIASDLRAQLRAGAVRRTRRADGGENAAATSLRAPPCASRRSWSRCG